MEHMAGSRQEEEEQVLANLGGGEKGVESWLKRLSKKGERETNSENLQVQKEKLHQRTCQVVGRGRESSTSETRGGKSI